MTARGGLMLIACGVAVYAIALIYISATQRRLMYTPTHFSGEAKSFGLDRTEDLALKTQDGETIVAWYQPAHPGKPVFVYFHGSGGSLASCAGFLRDLTRDGSGFLAVDYRGYGNSTGTPTEQGLLLDGEAAFAEARRLGVKSEDIVILGQSLGSGVAVAVAANHPVKALVLEGSFSSTLDVAAARYWMFPVRLFMLDTYKSSERIARVASPKLIIHGTGDQATPIAFAERLFAAAPRPKTFMAVPRAGHMALWSPEVLIQMKQWLSSLS